jgi:LIVCS family branched-chain amino acid:cation transporter
MTIQQQLQTQKTPPASLFTTGLALFSMFFGAGNLIFPLLIGKSIGSNVWYAICGLGLTAVVVPLLGLVAMMLFQADYSRFFGRIGAAPGLLLLLLLQLILGPFGVVPRLITLMHAIAGQYLNMSLMPFSLLAAGVIFACCFKPNRLIQFLGVVLTPILLLALAALVFFGLAAKTSFAPSSLSAMESLLAGLVGGYNTMDLIAAFLFATVVLPHFQKETHVNPEANPKSQFKKMLCSSLIAGSLLFLSYVGLCLVSAYHGTALADTCPPEQMLSAIAIQVLGPIGGGIAALAVMTACLTTAITLVSIFANYFRKDLCREKIGGVSALLITLLITTLFANLGFRGISAFLGPILQVVYPGLILLTILNLFHALYGQRMVRLPVFLTFAGSTILYLI